MVGIGIIIAIIAIILIVVMWVIQTYNRLVQLSERVKKALKDIDVQLQRRFDLIPNLVNTVKGYSKHEAEVLEKIAAYRSRYEGLSNDDVKEKSKMVSDMSRQISGIMVQLEAYPDLKANTNFLELQNELQSTEDKIAYSRQFYNDITTKYNMTIKMVPANIIATNFGFTEKELFEVEEAEARKSVKVEF